jgi:hypothetical protein
VHIAGKSSGIKQITVEDKEISDENLPAVQDTFCRNMLILSLLSLVKLT